ncbi:MAG: T9SS type A sorting domain-containing protein [Rhodanobacter sp.]|nr:MAG: T9SS type A sorting domain-containing protein [Rhodanobacter sp.]
MTGLFTDPSATVPYTGDPLATVYAKPATTTTYTGTSTSSETCTSSSDITVTVKPAPVVTVKADYCAVPGFVQLVATSVPAATSYNWSTGGTTDTTLVDEAKLYVVSANVDGCVGTGLMSVAQELVTNGDFEAGYIPGSFETDYNYVSAGGSLVPEGNFAIDTNAHKYHSNFYGKDHTTSTQTGKFLMINGYPNADTKIIWQQTVSVLPNTNYYYSAWAMNLNGVSPARLQFEVNGVRIGTIAELNGAPKPASESEVNTENWVRFYYGNTDGWNSGANTTAVIRIIDINPDIYGNDFGLDDISFATLSTFITRTSDLESDNQTVCKNSPIDKITYTVGSGGDGPIVSGLPNGVTSSFNGITLTISGNPDSVGVFTYTVVTQGHGSCVPTSTTGTITVTGQTISKPLDAGTDAQTICINTPAVPIKYNYGGTATDADVQGLPAGMSFSKNNTSKLITIYGTPSEPGLFTYSVFTTQGTCGHDTVTGTVNVTIQTINKTPESDTAQVICKGSGIIPILYEIKGTGTGATVSGLPAGISGSYNAGTGIYTISGTPTVTSGLYTYTVTTTGSCAASAAKGTIEITPDATIHLTSAPGTDNQRLCFNSGSIALITYQISVATGATVNGLPDGLAGVYSNGTFTISGTPTETGEFTYTVQTTGDCGQTSIDGNVQIDPEVSGGNLTYSYTVACSPASGTVTLSGETGTILGWESSINGTSWSAISNTTHSQNFTVNNTTYFRAKVDGGACGIALSNAVLIGVHNLWTGTTSSDWNDGTNWSDGNVPSPSCPDVVIPGGTPHQPILGSGMATINNLEIQNGAVLTINNNANIQIAGTINNSGLLDAKEGTVELNGSSAQFIAGSTFKNNALNNLIVSNSSVAGITITDALDIYRSITFGVNGKKLTTGGFLALKSTAIETAWLGNMTGKTLEGDVTVERYINVGEGGGYHGKSWQFVATPTQGQTVWQSWMENGSKTSTGYGTQITGPGGATKGFDLPTSTPSLKYYDYSSENWIGIDNTGISVFNKKGYLLFVRGDRSIKFPDVSNTTLRTKGQLFTPAHPPASTLVMADKSESVGNPYASAIDLNRVGISGGVGKIFIVWDPKLSGAYGLGSYQTLAQTKLVQGDNNFYATPGGGSYGSGPNNFIQSGQAFFVQATGSNGTVSFSENSKAGGSKMLLRGDVPALEGKFAEIQASLYGINGDGSSFLADGNLLQYNEGFTNKIDGLDARKLVNSAENFGIKSAGKNLVIERRKQVVESDTIHYSLAGTRNQNYRLEFAAKGLSLYGYQGYVEDTYLNTATPLSSEGTTEINFAVTNATRSKSADRFRIVFKSFAPLPVTFVSVKAQQKDADIVVNWRVENEKNMLQYDIEKSSDGVKFTKSGTVVAINSGQGSYQWTDQKVAAGYNYYRIKSASRDGKIEYSTVVKVLIADGKSSINIYPNPITDGIIHLQLGNQPQGMYGIRLLSPLGQVIVAKQVSHAGGNGTQNIKWDYNLAHGVYQLEVTKPNGEVAVIKVMY